MTPYARPDRPGDQQTFREPTLSTERSSPTQRHLRIQNQPGVGHQRSAILATDSGFLISENDTPTSQRFQSYLGDVGCMQIFSTDNAETPSTGALLMDRHNSLDEIPYELMQSYLETYFKYIHLWCPVLDKQTLQAQPGSLSSPLLKHALALCGARLQPPLITHTSCLDHYRRAKGLFYANYPDDPISQISAVMLFHWYSLSPPNLVTKDSNWWWIGMTIRLAQQIGLHREPATSQTAHSADLLAQRRRIWWTLFVSLASFIEGSKDGTEDTYR